jgi:hypothetical protein
MAITNVPKINGPDFGGVIYGLNLAMGYSQEPSKLTIDVVNKNGIYPTPSLGSSAQISFSNFTFNGIIWSYNIKENAGERILQIELIDNSIILDRHYVILWKRGIFDDLGTKANLAKEFDLSDETVLVPIRVGFSEIQFKEKPLGITSVSREAYFASKKEGNIIYLGREKFPDTQCDIPDTYYTFNDLKNTIGSIVDGVNWNAPANYKATHEGTLREVLQAWAADCGVDFYWDFERNRIQSYMSNQGINLNLPNLTNVPSILEKSESASLDGTFAQYALAYTAYPREEVNVISNSVELTYTIQINSFPISWFLSKNGTLGSLNIPEVSEGGTDDDPKAAERNLWGGRLKDEFLKAAFLGYINEALRDLYIYGIEKKYYLVLGFTPLSTSGTDSSSTAQGGASAATPITGEDKTKILNFLKENATKDLEELEKIDAAGCPNFDFIFGIIDQDLNSKWKQIEQDILKSYGSIYRHTVRGSSSYYCSPTQIIQMQTTVDPEPDDQEPMSSDFKGRKIFRRGGSFNYDPSQISSILKIDESEFRQKLEQARSREFDLVSSGLNALFPKTKAKSLLIVPNSSLVSKILGGSGLSIRTTKIGNPLEATVFDNETTEQEEFNCDIFSDEVENSKCKSALSEAQENEYKRLGADGNNANPASVVSGLANRLAQAAIISINGQEIRLIAPSDAPYVVVVNYNINIENISKQRYPQKIFFNKSLSGNPNQVARLDVIYDNVTDPLEDNYGKKRLSSIPLAQAISNQVPQKKVTYTFAGFPVGLTLSPRNGLSNVDISYSSDGFKTTVTYSSRAPYRTEVDTFLRKIQSQFNRSSFKAT